MVKRSECKGHIPGVTARYVTHSTLGKRRDRSLPTLGTVEVESNRSVVMSEGHLQQLTLHHRQTYRGFWRYRQDALHSDNIKHQAFRQTTDSIMHRIVT